MELTDLISIIAIIVGPILAVQIQKFLERNRDNRNRKVQIFKSLMASRGSVLSSTHVEALNRIDLEFSDNKKYKKVIDSWKEYFDNLSNRARSEEELKIWADRNEQLLANLLFEMGNSLGYSFDKVLIKRNIYNPQAFANMEMENDFIRKGVLRILSGESSLPVSSIIDEESLSKQKEMQDLIINQYKNKIPTYVKLVEE